MNEEESKQTYAEKAYESRQTFDEKFKDFTSKVGQYTSGLLAFGIAIWWIFYGTVEIYPTRLNLTEQVGLAIATSVLATCYCGLISHGGFSSAKKSSAYKKETKEWGELINATIQDRKAVNRFAREEAITNLRNVIKENYDNNELVYSEFYNEKNEFIGVGFQKRKDLTKHQKKIISKCLKLKIQIPNLYGAASAKMFGLKREEEQTQFERKEDGSRAIIRVLLSLVSVSVMFNFLGISLSSLVFALFQIVLWTASGFSSRTRKYDWVMNKGLPQIVEKKLILLAWTRLDENEKIKYRTE